MGAQIIDFNPGAYYLVDFGSNSNTITINNEVYTEVPRYVKIDNGWLPSALHRQAVCVIRSYEGSVAAYVWIKHPTKSGKVVQQDLSLVAWQLISSIDWKTIYAT